MRSASKLTPRHVHTAQISLYPSLPCLSTHSAAAYIDKHDFWTIWNFIFEEGWMILESVEICFFAKFPFEESTFFEFMLKSCKFRKTRDRSHSADPKRDCPRGGQIQPSWGFLAILFPCCHPTCRQLPGRHRCVPTGKHSPHPKDCPGLGDPHTLKLRTN